MKRTLVWATTALVLATPLGACTLIDPYVTVDPKTSPSGAASVGTDAGRQDARNYALYYGDLPAQRDRAANLANRYQSAAASHARARNGMSAALIPLNAAALFAASTGLDSDSDFIPAVGFGSAAALGVAGVLTSPPRQQVYLAGRNAVNCARSATDPFMITWRDHRSYLADDAELARAATDAALQLRYVRGFAPSSASVGAAEAQVQSARTTLADLSGIRAGVDMAGRRLSGQLVSISNEVDKQVARTEPDIDRIKSALTITPTVTIPAPASAGGAPLGASGDSAARGAPPPRPLTAPQQAQIIELDRRVWVLADSQQRAERFVTRFKTTEQGAPDMASCRVTEIVAGLLIVAPTPLALPAAGNPIVVVVISPQGNPIVAVAGAPGVATKVDPVPGAKTYNVELTAPAGTAAGPRILIVQSPGGDKREIPFTVEAAGGGPGPAAAPPAPSTPPPSTPAPAEPADSPGAAPPVQNPAPVPPIAPVQMPAPQARQPTPAPAPAQTSLPALAPVQPPASTTVAAPTESRPPARRPAWLTVDAARVLGLKGDGSDTEDSIRARVEAYATEHQVPAWVDPANLIIDPAIWPRMTEALQINASASEPLSAYELFHLSSARLRLVQSRFNVPATGRMDAATRAAVGITNQAAGRMGDKIQSRLWEGAA